MEPWINAHKNYTQKPDLSLFDEHTHDTYEIFCFLSGDAQYFVEGNIYDLKPNDVLIIKKSEAHALLIRKDVPYTRYVVNFNEAALLEEQRPALLAILDQKMLGRANRIPSMEAEKNTWLHYLNRIVQAKTLGEKRIYLTVLLQELCGNIRVEPSEDTLTENQRIIAYINLHLTAITTLDEICSHFYISKTHLNRKFKSMLGTTAWEYILTKRLIAAKDLLRSGMQPTTVSRQCGWEEYSAFYRAYKLRFGVPPKADYIRNK